MKKQLALTLLAVLLTIGMTSTALAEEEETEVEVEVDDTVQLDVKPDNLDYTAGGDFETSDLSPGEQREVSDRGFEHIDIENIGSDRLDNIFAEATMNEAQAFGVAPETTDHNTGNFVLMSTETAHEDDYRVANEGGLADVDQPHYLNRVEYFEEQPPEYIQAHDDSDTLDVEVDVGVESGTTNNDDLDEVDIGRFRVGEASYFFAYYETVQDDILLFVGNTPETPTELGTFDFTSDNEEEFTVIGLEGDGSGQSDVHLHDDPFTLVSFDVEDEDYDGEATLDGNGDEVDVTDVDQENREYNIYVDRSTDENELVARTKFNIDLETPNDQDTDAEPGGAQELILDATNDEEALQPGENFPVDFGVQVPNGVDHDAMTEGTVTFNAEAR